MVYSHNLLSLLLFIITICIVFYFPALKSPKIRILKEVFLIILQELFKNFQGGRDDCRNTLSSTVHCSECPSLGSDRSQAQTTYLSVHVECFKVVVIRQLLTGTDVLQGEQSNPVHAVDIPVNTNTHERYKTADRIRRGAAVDLKQTISASRSLDHSCG